MVEVMNKTYYEQLASAPGATPTGAPPKTDYRRTSDPDNLGKRDLCTHCGLSDKKAFSTCRYGRKATNTDERCFYLKFGFMCDKVLSSKGEPLN
ncbi:MAG: hypothetical protein ACYTBJ_24580 [Planctomycetota bacterium]|jgi:hypothetical protein